MAFFANLFGYLLNFIYNLIGNYGWAIIVFCIVIKILMIPLSIKQQKALKKNNKLQAKMKEIQFKYKNDPERMNQATIELYKEENASPFAGCFTAIIQLVLLISVFYLVRSPLTYMKKVDADVINKYTTLLEEENLSMNGTYPEIEIVRETETLKTLENEKIDKSEIEKLDINMEFLGLDLGQIPSQNKSDWKVFIIPILYVLVSFISVKISLVTPATNQKEEKEVFNEDGTKAETNEETGDMQDVMAQTNKNMSMIFPIMYLSVAIIAPLGLALYWLVNSLLMIAERLILNKVIKEDE